MHRDLHMRNLERLPISIRRIASLAVSDRRTLTHVQNARNLLDSPTLSESQRVAFTPIFFHNLNPTRIPAPEHLEKLEEVAFAIEDIACAAISLDGIRHCLYTKGAIGLSLWPRVWPWVEFINLHRTQLESVGIDLAPEETFHIDFLLFFGAFRGHKTTFALMCSTPGFWTCFVETWKFLAQVDSPQMRGALLDDIGGILCSSRVRSHPERLEEMIQAAGSLDELAILIVDYIRTVVADGAALPSLHPISHMNRLLLFVTVADGFSEQLEYNTWENIPLGSLSRALSNRDCAQELVDAVLVLHCIPRPCRQGCALQRRHLPTALGTPFLLCLGQKNTNCASLCRPSAYPRPTPSSSCPYRWASSPLFTWPRCNGASTV
ncbi:hypothetical protein FB45DRAFT_147146 [Roridomyces roridus]|uniref:Uncharacterized protein n=1 Tax=Roridomyces roridus TaxID=1738132 RepID=A0AAD7BG99_9AGAR|nr:hypothetical protein FB45DRAFT_147146 [Roridomyces roridus]